MTTLKTEHDGYELVYDDRDDVWWCRSLSLSNRSLKRLKAEIGKTLARSRRLDNPALLFIERYHGGRPATGTLIDAGGKAVWCMVKPRHNGDNTPPEREKVPLSDLVLDTKENRARLAEARLLDAEAGALRETAKAIRAAIPRVTLADLRSIEEGDDAP